MESGTTQVTPTGIAVEQRTFSGLVIVGRAGAGKDYVLDRISAAVGRVVPVRSWQLGLHYYEQLAKRIGIPVSTIVRDKELYRPALQEIGATPSERRLAVENSLDLWTSTRGVPLLIARKPDEVEPFRRHGAVVISVEADEETRLERLTARGGGALTPGVLEHETETEVDLCVADVVLYNGAGAGEIVAVYDGSLLTFANARESHSIRLLGQ